MQQCEILNLNRSTLYYKYAPEFTEEEKLILNIMDEIFTELPFYGYRRLWRELKKRGYKIGQDKVLNFMHVLGLETLYPKKRKTSIANKRHRIYPYLLSNVEINKPNQVWCADITYIRLAKGFCYLVVIMDWYSRRILSYKVSNSLETYFCTEALNEALAKYPKPEIFNTDQGSQFTSEEFTGILLTNKIKISMDSKGRAFDNIMVERFFRTIKYENIYLYNYDSIALLKDGLKYYIDFYNNSREHSSLDNKTPARFYIEESEVILIDDIKKIKMFEEWFVTISNNVNNKRKNGQS